MSKNLIVYFSRKGENYVNGAIEYLEKGNTEIVAEMIQKTVGGDLFEIVPVNEYDNDYYKCIEEARRELNENARPEISPCAYGIEAYDTVYLCYPNWWGTCPMCVFTFLEKFDWTGKKIVPLCTNEGSGMGSSESGIRRICKGAAVLKGLPIRGAEVADAYERVANFLDAIK